MLDPFSALGLARNIIQFVDFGSKLVSGSIELYRSADGTSEKGSELASIASGLKIIASSLENAEHNDVEIGKLAKECKKQADRLLEVLQDLTVKEPHRYWKTFQQALRTVLKDKEIRDIERRLDQWRSTLILRLTKDLGDKSSDISNHIRHLELGCAQKGIYCDNRLAQLKDELLVALDAKACESREHSERLGMTLRDLVVTVGTKMTDNQFFLASLAFKTMSMRYCRVPKAHTRTFDWILLDSLGEKSPPTKFPWWLRQGSGIYWIAGKAGSGKSTLMKYITNHHETTLTGTHFGLPPSLRDDPNWSLPNLIAVLEWLSQQQALPVRFCFFIDGLDEYDGDPVIVIDLLRQLSASPAIKLCVSSRPWTEINSSLQLGADKRIMLQDFTTQDIQLYIHDILEQDPLFADRIPKDQNYQLLTQEIMDRSRGVFLWVFLVVRSLLRGLRHEDSISDLRRRLAHLPPDLESFLKQMLQDIEPVYHFQTAQILQMCLAAGEALPLHMFSFLDDEAQDGQDLVEISLQKPQLFFVNFLHETVREFLLTKEMQEILSKWGSPSFNPYRSLCQASIAWMKSLPRAGEQCRSCIEDFLFYMGQIETRDCYTSFDTILMEEMDSVAHYHWVDTMMQLPGLFGAWERGWIFTLGSQAGLSTYVTQRLEKSPAVARQWGGTALYCTLIRPMGSRSGMFQDLNLEILRTLFKHGADPNISYGGFSIWVRFLKSCASNSIDTNANTRATWASAFQLLLEHGADPEAIYKVSDGEWYMKQNLKEEVDFLRIKAVEFMRQCCPDQGVLLEELLESKRKFGFGTLYRWIGRS